MDSNSFLFSFHIKQKNTLLPNVKRIQEATQTHINIININHITPVVQQTCLLCSVSRRVSETIRNVPFKPLSGPTMDHVLFGGNFTTHISLPGIHVVDCFSGNFPGEFVCFTPRILFSSFRQSLVTVCVISPSFFMNGLLFQIDHKWMRIRIGRRFTLTLLFVAHNSCWVGKTEIMQTFRLL